MYNGQCHAKARIQTNTDQDLKCDGKCDRMKSYDEKKNTKS